MKKFFSHPAALVGLGLVLGILAAFAYARYLGVFKTVAAKLPGSQPTA